MKKFNKKGGRKIQKEAKVKKDVVKKVAVGDQEMQNGADPDPIEKIDSNYKLNLEIIEAAAIFIQKNYRGYRTRKIVRERLRQLLVKEMINNGDNLQELIDIGLEDYIEEALKEQNTMDEVR